MKRALIICLAVLTLLTFDNSAEAGRRKDRKAAKKGGGGIYGGSSQRYQSNSGHAYPVTKANYAEPTIAAAAVPAPASAPTPTLAAAAPDLTITEIATVGDVLAFTVQNIGPVASPETRLEVALTKPQAAFIESQNVRVLPLLPGQSVRIRLHSVPQADIHADGLVDPDRLVAESNEENNDLRVTLATAKVAEVPPTLADDSTWSQAGN